MPTPFKLGGQKGVENFLCLFGRGDFSTNAENVRFVVTAGQPGHFFTKDQGRANPRNLVCRDAHADTGRADQHAEIALSLSHALRHGLCVIGIIGGLCGLRSEIVHDDSAFQQMLLQTLFQFETAVIGANRDDCLVRVAHRIAIGLLHKFEERRDPLLDLIAALLIRFKRAADRIADVFFVGIERFIEFAEQKCFLGGKRIKQVDRINMAVGHPENIIGLLHEFGGQHATALTGNIDAQLFHGANGMRAGRLSVDGAHAGRKDAQIASALDGVAKQAFSHGAAADISGANEKDGLHSRVMLSNCGG